MPYLAGVVPPIKAKKTNKTKQKPLVVVAVGGWVGGWVVFFIDLMSLIVGFFSPFLPRSSHKTASRPRSMGKFGRVR